MLFRLDGIKKLHVTELEDILKKYCVCFCTLLIRHNGEQQSRRDMTSLDSRF